MNTRILPPPTAELDPRVAFFDHHAHCWEDNPQSNASILRRLGCLRERLGLRFGLRVLEVGCGTGLITGWLTDCVGGDRVTAMDFSPAMLAKAKAKGIPADFRQLDICKSVPAGAAFDLALCFQSFPHFRDQQTALRHLASSLKTQGRLIVLHLASSEEINAYHHRIGGDVAGDLLPASGEWPALMIEAGLRIQSLEDRPDLFFLEAVRI